MSNMNISNFGFNDIKMLNPDDPNILEQCHLEPLPELKTSFANADEMKAEYEKYKKLYISHLVMAAVIDYRREKLFSALQNSCIACEEESDDEPKKKPSPKKPLSDSDEEESDDEPKKKPSPKKKSSPKKSSPKKPLSDSDDEKTKTTHSTQYQSFMMEKLKDLRKKHPNLQNKEYMLMAAKEWAAHKKKHGITPSSMVRKTQHQKPSDDSDDSNNSSSESSSDSSSEEEVKSYSIRPMSAYQKFISEELQRQRKINPGLPNKEYMKLAAEAWNAHKKENGIKTSSTIQQSNIKSEPEDSDSSSTESDDDSSSSSSESEEEYVPPKNRPTKQPTAYQKFISTELKKQRELNPGLQNKEYMLRAVKAWDEYKKTL
ncbi:hypothetical protein QJ856_gp0108 [Tupanvirus deep ocean]|uniref:Uncharacterized protein n=2 Tax=Tupanvirus TaxID=2094720 RepID=A0AC62AA40_9VIRU|nr:hypothetical protein QJ856_gp0108 [Tupanvirus deep ocean]QKU34619.1 hypothetical protein [Tupanvirus deep ocean]